MPVAVKRHQKMHLVRDDPYAIVRANRHHPVQFFLRKNTPRRVMGIDQQENRRMILFDFLLKVLKINLIALASAPEGSPKAPSGPPRWSGGADQNRGYASG